MNPVIEDEEVFIAQVREIVGFLEAAPALAAQGVRVVSCDEKTGMQAIERLGQWSMRPGQPERQESWYRRHGTLCLTANLDLATGQVVSPTLEKTRKNEDFLRHVQRTVATDPDAQWVFIVDNLDTHSSAALIEWVAARCGVTEDLGQLYKRGHLRNRVSRRAFLSTTTHAIRFVYTPKHCSWLNEIERWFSKLARSVLRRGSFTSLHELHQRVLKFIDYYNVVNAKPHKSRSTADEILKKMRIETSEGLN